MPRTAAGFVAIFGRRGPHLSGDHSKTPCQSNNALQIRTMRDNVLTQERQISAALSSLFFYGTVCPGDGHLLAPVWYPFFRSMPGIWTTAIAGLTTYGMDHLHDRGLTFFSGRCHL